MNPVQTPVAPMSVIDAVTVAFGAATVVLAVVAIGLAVGGWFVYRDIRINAQKVAATIAKATAETEARVTAEIVALREISAYMKITGVATENVSAAYRVEPLQQDQPG